MTRLEALLALVHLRHDLARLQAIQSQQQASQHKEIDHLLSTLRRTT